MHSFRILPCYDYERSEHEIVYEIKNGGVWFTLRDPMVASQCM
jgi:hypothetical protein